MIKALIAIALALVALVWGFWLVAVPADVLEGSVCQGLAPWGMRVEPCGFTKGLFYSVSNDSLVIRRSGLTLVSITGLRGHLDMLSVLLLRPMAPFEANVNGGSLSGRAAVGLQGLSGVEFELKGARVEQTAIGELAGVDVKGALSIDATVKGGTADAKFRIDGLEAGAASLGGVTIPLDMFNALKGAVFIKGDVMEIESLTLEGEDVYARAAGTVKAGRMDIKLEIMPGDAAMKRFPAFSLLGRYMVTPGHYVIPVRGKVPFI